jgi:hypothetical protein
MLGDVITRRIGTSLTLLAGLFAASAVVLGHAVARLPSAHLDGGGVERDVLAELAFGVVLAVVALTVWMAEGAQRASGRLVLRRVAVVGLLVGAAITGAVALFSEAGNGCLGACG